MAVKISDTELASARLSAVIKALMQMGEAGASAFAAALDQGALPRLGAPQRAGSRPRRRDAAAARRVLRAARRRRRRRAAPRGRGRERRRHADGRARAARRGVLWVERGMPI